MSLLASVNIDLSFSAMAIELLWWIIWLAVVGFLFLRNTRKSDPSCIIKNLRVLKLSLLAVYPVCVLVGFLRFFLGLGESPPDSIFDVLAYMCVFYPVVLLFFYAAGSTVVHIQLNLILYRYFQKGDCISSKQDYSKIRTVVEGRKLLHLTLSAFRKKGILEVLKSVYCKDNE